MASRTFAIGDIHGCDTAFDTLLAHLQLTPGDRLIVLGDIVDRGPGSRQVIERLLDLRNHCQVDLILGNHDEMMLDSLSNRGDLLSGWLSIGGRETVESYGGDIANIPREHLDFLKSASALIETENDIFVHANLRLDVPLDRQDPEWLRWTRLDMNQRPHPSGRRVVCGHTSQKSGDPLVFDGWVCLDTFVYGGGWLTCLNVDTNKIMRANQRGELAATRDLDEFRI